MYIDNPQSLAEYCARHKGSPCIGFDTEFIRERTYFPRLEIIQVIADGEIAVIDFQSINHMEPLWEMLCDPDSEKVVHSGIQDMELFLQESGRLPAPVFDTQIVASLLGLGSQCGYGRLVFQILGRKVAKGETFSDWSRRPLHPSQIHYAEGDVAHLIDLREALGKRLSKLGRERWVYEECRHLSNPETFQKHPPEKCFLRIKGRNGLDPAGLSVLRSLAHWRDLEARSRNVPPSRIVHDHVILSMAKSAPSNIEELKRQRGLHSNEINRCGLEIITAIREGIEKAEIDPVEIPPSKGHSLLEEDDGLFKFLSALIQVHSESTRVAPSTLATTQELRGFLNGYRQNKLNTVALMKGWRKDMVGDKLLKAMQGRISLRFDPESDSLTMEELDGPPLEAEPE